MIITFGATVTPLWPICRSCSSQPQSTRGLDLSLIHIFFEDMKLAEVAQAAGCTLSTAKSRLYKALALLRLELDDGEV